MSRLVGLVRMERYGPPRDTVVWLCLPAIAALYVAGRSGLGPALGRLLGLIGAAVWLPLFFQSGAKKTHGVKAWGTVLGIAITADIAYMAFGPLAAGTQLSLQSILGFLHWPVAFAMGTPAKDCFIVGRLLG